jgi:hypothetical protein
MAVFMSPVWVPDRDAIWEWYKSFEEGSRLVSTMVHEESGPRRPCPSMGEVSWEERERGTGGKGEGRLEITHKSRAAAAGIIYG